MKFRCLCNICPLISCIYIYSCTYPYPCTNTCKHREDNSGWTQLKNPCCCIPSTASLSTNLCISVSPSKEFQKCHWWTTSSLAYRTFIMVKEKLSAWHSGPQLSSRSWWLEWREHSACKWHMLEREIFVCQSLQETHTYIYSFITRKESEFKIYCLYYLPCVNIKAWNYPLALNDVRLHLYTYFIIERHFIYISSQEGFFGGGNPYEMVPAFFKQPQINKLKVVRDGKKPQGSNFLLIALLQQKSGPRNFFKCVTKFKYPKPWG